MSFRQSLSVVIQVHDRIVQQVFKGPIGKPEIGVVEVSYSDSHKMNDVGMFGLESA